MEDTTTTSMPTYQNPSVPKTVMTPEQKEAEESMRSYLGRTMRVTLPDNRTVAGMALCIDGAGNLILQEVTETVTKVCVCVFFIVCRTQKRKVEIAQLWQHNQATLLQQFITKKCTLFCGLQGRIAGFIHFFFFFKNKNKTEIYLRIRRRS